MTVYNTLSFWLCVVLAVVNAGLLIVAGQVHRPDLQVLAFSCLLLSAVGGFSHWDLDRKHSKRKGKGKE